MSGRAGLVLRFPDGEEEAGFQADLNEALLPIIRTGILIGMWIWPVVGALVVSIGAVNVPGVWVIMTAMFAVNVVALILLRHPRSLHSVESMGAVVCALGGIATIATVPVSGLPSLGVYVIPGLMLVAIYAFVVFQLPAGAGLVAMAVCLVAFLVAPLPRVSVAATALDVSLIATATGLGAMAAHLLERSMRVRYSQGRLIEAQSQVITAERAKSDRLLLNVLPARIADRLREEPGSLAEEFDDATVLFADLAGFTPISERIGPQRTADMLNELVSRFDDLAEGSGLEKIKTIGDAYLLVGGVPELVPDHAVRVVRMGLSMIEMTSAYARECGLPLALRVGVHTGPVVAGVIGRTKFAYDIWGDTVNVASRLEGAGVVGELQASATTIAALGDEYEVEPRGPIELKGKGSVLAFLVRDKRPPEAPR
jgi:adenylate cyclase